MPSSSETSLEVSDILERSVTDSLKGIHLHGYLIYRCKEMVVLDMDVDGMTIENWLDRPYIRIGVPGLMFSVASVVPLRAGGVSDVFAESKIRGDLIYNHGDNIWEIFPTEIICKSFRKGAYDTRINLSEEYIAALKPHPDAIFGWMDDDDYVSEVTSGDWLEIEIERLEHKRKKQEISN